MTLVSNLTTSVGDFMMNAFGNQILAALVFLIIFFMAIYRAGMPADGALVIGACLIIAFSGVFIPQWITGFIVIGMGAITAAVLWRVYGGA